MNDPRIEKLMNMVEQQRKQLSELRMYRRMYERGVKIMNGKQSQNSWMDIPVKYLFADINYIAENLSTRPWFFLLRSKIEYVGELIQMDEKELVKNQRNFGKKSLEELRDALKKLHPSLQFGMVIPEWDRMLFEWKKDQGAVT
jgi:DNA-directed RNA polymerase alpha subunit